MIAWPHVHEEIAVGIGHFENTRVGDRFVERFPVLNNPTLSTDDAIQLLITDSQEKNPAEDETTSRNCAVTMVSTGRRIIKAGRGEDALRNIAISKEVDIDARQTARLILRKLEQTKL